MAISFYCPKTDCAGHTQPLILGDALAGKRVRCQSCGVTSRVPGMAQPVASSEGPAEVRSSSSGRLILSLAGLFAGLLVLGGVAFWIAFSGSKVDEILPPPDLPERGNLFAKAAAGTKERDASKLLDPSPFPKDKEGQGVVPFPPIGAKDKTNPDGGPTLNPEEQDLPIPPKPAPKEKDPEPSPIPPLKEKVANIPIKLPPAKKDLIAPFIEEKEIAQRVVKAGGKIGQLTISLAWQNFNDLDLHVLTPRGENIFYGHRRSICGGELDIDQNVAPTTRTPVENVFWKNNVPEGKMKIYVHLYLNHRRPGSQDPSRFTVRVQMDDEVKIYNGEVSGQNKVLVAEINTTAGRPAGQPKGLDDEMPDNPFDPVKVAPKKKPNPKPKVKINPADPQTRALEKLQQARTSLQEGNFGLAKVRLQIILVEYPMTEAAVAARALLVDVEKMVVPKTP